MSIWNLNTPGAAYDDVAARELAEALRKQPGFRSFTVLLTDPQEVAAVAVFESKEQLRKAHVLLDRRVAPKAARGPRRQRGDVLLKTTAWEHPAPSSH